MYKKILVAVENKTGDENIIEHISQLAQKFQSEVLLLHVADGWVARNFDNLKLAESEEMKADRDYIENLAKNFREKGLESKACLALGDPATEILKTATREQCDLIAMTTHGHRLVGDFFLGSTIHEVRHQSRIPILLVRAAGK